MLAQCTPACCSPSPAETYLLITRLLGWDPDTYQAWLATTGTRLAGVADGNS
jgi:hypothetical protein